MSVMPEVHHRLHLVGHARVGLGRGEGRIVGGVGHHQGEVSAGRSAHRGDAVGIDAQLLGVGPEIADAVLAVLQVDGEFPGGAQGVVDAGGDESVFGEEGAELDLPGLGLVAFLPAAAVDEQDGGGGFPGFLVLGKIEVEFFRPAFGEERDVGAELHFGGVDRRFLGGPGRGEGKKKEEEEREPFQAEKKGRGRLREGVWRGRWNRRSGPRVCS